MGFLKAEEYRKVTMTNMVPANDRHDAIRSVNSKECS